MVGNREILLKKAGLGCIVLAAFAIVAYAQTTKPQAPRARSTNIGSSSGYLGVAFQDVTPDAVKVLGLKDTTGVLITSVTEGQAGARAGIRVRDVILEFDGQRVESGEK